MPHFYTCLAILFALIASPVRAQQQEWIREYQHLDSICDAMKNEQPAVLIEHTRRMLEIAHHLQSDTMMLNAAFLQGQALDFLGLFDAALKVDFDNLALAEKTGNCYYKVKTAGLIGRIYQIMGDLPKCGEYALKGKQYAISCRQFVDTIYLNYDIGFNMAEQGDLEGGIRVIEKSLAAARQTGDKSAILFGIDNLFNLLSETGQYQKALEVELELVQKPELLNDNLDKAQIYEHLAEIYVLLKDWDNAQKYQAEALKYAQIAHLNDWIYECYRLQSEIDEARGDYRSALLNQRLYATLKDSVYRSEYEGRMAAMSALYDLENKQKTITLLEKDQQIQRDRILQQRMLMFSGLLVALVAFLAYRFYVQRQTQKMRVAFSQELLKAQEVERQRISKELHDSVGQNVLFVKNRLLRLSDTPDPLLMNSVDNVLEDIRSIAKNLYPNQLEVYGLSAAVETLCEQASEASGVFISSDLQGLDEKLNKEAKINCYRIIQECINNALKHAEATAIRISAELHGNKMDLVVQDNGKGFDKDKLERQSSRSFGIINMEERARMLRGKLYMDTALNKGVKLTLSIPL